MGIQELVGRRERGIMGDVTRSGASKALLARQLQEVFVPSERIQCSRFITVDIVVCAAVCIQEIRRYRCWIISAAK